MKEKITKNDVMVIVIDVVMILLFVVGIWLRFSDGSRLPVILCMAASGIAIVAYVILYVLYGMNGRLLIINILAVLLVLAGLIFSGMEYADRKPSLADTEKTLETTEADDYWVVRQDFSSSIKDYSGTVFGLSIPATLEDADVLDIGGVFYAHEKQPELDSETEKGEEETAEEESDHGAASENEDDAIDDTVTPVEESVIVEVGSVSAILEADALIGNFGEYGDAYRSFFSIYNADGEAGRTELYIDNYTDDNANVTECAKKNWWHIGTEQNPDIFIEMFGTGLEFDNESRMNDEDNLELLLDKLGSPSHIAVKKNMNEAVEAEGGEAETLSLEENLRRFGMDPNAQFAYTLVWEHDDYAIMLDVVENPTNNTQDGAYTEVQGAWYYTKESFKEYKERMFVEYKTIDHAKEMVEDVLKNRGR